MLNQWTNKWLSHPLKQLEMQRKNIKMQASWPQGLRQLLSQPMPQMGAMVQDLPFLALDFETTGLHPADNAILTIGTVPLSKGQIQLNQAFHQYVLADGKIHSESAIVNHIVPEMLKNGAELDKAMDALFEKMAGKAVLVHGAMVEKAFVDHYVQQRFGLEGVPILWVDTLQIEKALTYGQKAQEVTVYQLSYLRDKYRLPNYPSHNALMDAISCAELFLAQLVNIFGKSAHQTKIEAIFNKNTAPKATKSFL